MNDQDEIERLKREVERLQEALRTSEHERRKTDALLTQFTTGDSLINNLEFITDLARYAEGVLSEATVKKKYHFDDASWESLGEDEALIEAIEAEKVRRVRNGSAKREKAQQHIVKAPDILSAIMCDDGANARHRVDSIKALDALADPGPKAAPTLDRFVIKIDLTADQKLPNPNDIIVIDATPRKTPAAITDKTEDDWKKW